MSSFATAQSWEWDAYRETTRPATERKESLAARLAEIKLSEQSLASNWINTVQVSIRQLRQSFAKPNWDGYGAVPIDSQAIENALLVARRLASLLPPGTPAPDVVPEVDGDVSLNWTIDPERSFSLSVSSGDSIAYAGQLSEGKEPHGVERFDPGDTYSPSHVASFISRLYSGPSRNSGP